MPEEKSKLPEWVRKMVGRKQTVRQRNGHFYLYDVEYEYDKEKKRSAIKSIRMAGTLDQVRGLVPARRRRAKGERVSAFEFGATDALESLGPDIREGLRECFGVEDGDCIMALAKFGLTDREPEKRIQSAYQCSYESVRFPGLPLSGSSISKLTERIGLDREAQVRFMRRYTDGVTHVIFDGTRLVCQSMNNPLAAMGYNHIGLKDPQVNLMYCFSLKPRKMPVYFRALPGSMPDVSGFITCVREIGIRGITVIADTGFESLDNSSELKESGICFIRPLKRNDSRMKYLSEPENPNLYDGSFLYRGRPIFYKRLVRHSLEKAKGRWGKRGRPPKGWKPSETVREVDGITLFYDESLAAEERATFLKGLAEGRDGYGPEAYAAIHPRMGTIAIAANGDQDPRDVYSTYKERELIEDGNKAYKDVLDRFASHKRSEPTYLGWLFVNHVSLMLYYRVVEKIRESGHESDYSAEDVIDAAKRIQMVKMGDEWLETLPTLKDLRPYDQVLKKG